MEQFLKDLIDLMDTEESLTMETELNSIDEWDSLSIVSFLSYGRNKCGKQINSSDVKSAKKVKDLYDLVK